MLQAQLQALHCEATFQVGQQRAQVLCYAPTMQHFAAVVHWGGPKRTELTRPLKQVQKEG
jgi:hypothetical protein